MPDATCKDGKSSWTNVFGYLDYTGTSYNGRCAFFGGKPALPVGLGWFIVVGLGAVFAIFVSIVQYLADSRIEHNSTLSHSSEHFGSAGRTISSGWIACHIVSQWTWAATLLQSSNVAYTFGVSGPFWYASGATIQVLLFAVLAVEIKRKCPAIHTVCEITLARWGTSAHITYITFVIITQLIVTAMLILGGAATVTALCGMNVYAASFLIPLSAVPFTMHGGLNATFISAWAHVAIIYIAMLIFMWKVYAGPSELGSTDKVWENLVVAAEKNPVKWNKDGSFLTMWSTQGIIFGIINIIGNFGTVFCDQAYWQGAIAARPSATYKGYLLGGIAWFSIPFSMATTLGLCGRAFDLPITAEESGNGLVPPAVATHLLGEGGSFLVLLQLFMAVTASAASEQIAISSIFSYDIYKRYINPAAKGQQIVFVARASILFWACISGVLSIILHELKIGLGWVYLAMGNFIGSAVFPVAFALTWSNCSAVGAMAGTWLGAGFSMLGWCLCANRLGGVNVKTLGDDFSMLTGNLIALFFSPIITVIISVISPQKFEWAELRRKTQEMLILDDIDKQGEHVTDSVLLGLDDLELTHGHAPAAGEAGAAPASRGSDPHDETNEELTKVLMFSYWFGGGLSFVLIIVWPLLSLPQTTFTKSYWGWWVAIAFIWGHCAAAITIIYPLYQVRELIAVALGLKSPTVPPGHIAGTFHIETEEGTYRGRFLAPVSVKIAEPVAQKPEILMAPAPPPVFMVGQAFGCTEAGAGRPEIEYCA